MRKAFLRNVAKTAIVSIASFVETEMYATLIQEIRTQGRLPTDANSLDQLLRKARDNAVNKLMELRESQLQKR